MLRARICLLLLLASGCSDSKPTPKPVPRNIARAEQSLLTGFPDSPELAAFDRRGGWAVKGPTIEHWIVDPGVRTPLVPEENNPAVTLFRDSLPFPQVTWKAGDYEVTELLFPAGTGFVARYQVMNHGEDAHKVQFRIGPKSPEGPAPVVPVDPPTITDGAQIGYDLVLEPGVPRFIQVTSPDLKGRPGEDALDRAIERWEKLIGDRYLKLPDAAATTAYYTSLAGQMMGVAGCEEIVARTEKMLAARDGDAIRIFPAIPEAWVLEAIEARGLPTDFGPLSFKYQGVYNNRTFVFQPGCSPPGGYRIVMPPKLVARIDGKDAAPREGVLIVPAGAKFVELSYPR